MKTSFLGIRDTLLAKHLPIFSAREFGVLLSLSNRQTLYYLQKGTENGLFIQAKRGMYYLKTDPPSELEIANQLYRPSYLSFEFALAYYNILPDMVYTITSATTKPTREYMVDSKSFRYTTIKLRAYTGYEMKVADHKRFFIADPEKAIVDYLYAVSLGRRALSERLDLSTVDVNKVKIYTKLFASKSLNALVAKVFDK
ncbi:MAG: hypothetical protein Q8L37_00540 [Candidatus Gottesmanbacteria bacterium]|nr:hypothetical protein [Candidatus Gottesmanbacteria bacterium]